jgi:hypothetical protein
MNRLSVLWSQSMLPVSLGLLACDVPAAQPGSGDSAAATPRAAPSVAASAASAPVRSIYSIVPD